MDIRLIPEGGDNPYAHHPGFCATGCPHRITVTAHRSGTTSSGFACAETGGHCLPGTVAYCTPAAQESEP